MAKTDNTGNKKQSLVQKIMFGDENKPDVAPEKSNVTKWQMFKYLFFQRFGTIVVLNLFTLIFALPAIAVIVLFYMNITVSNGFLPFSSNLGFGYPVVVDAVQQGVINTFMYHMYEFMFLIPCIAIFALGVSGNLYVVRKMIWEETTSTIKDFFRGIKKCWFPALMIGLFDGLTALLFVFSLGYFDAYGGATSVKALSITLSSILVVFMSLFTAFFMTQNAAFKMRPLVLIRNSTLFVLGTNVQAIFFVAIAVAPAFLAFIPGITVLLVILYVFLGFSFATVVISLFCHHCYEKFLYDKIDKPSAVYTRRENDLVEEREREQTRRRQAPVPYKNPKKRKRSIDEGSNITPLMPTFRREDLERLEREHEAVMNESQDSADDPDADLGELDDDADITQDAVSITPAEDVAITPAEDAGSGEASDNAVIDADTDGTRGE